MFPFPPIPANRTRQFALAALCAVLQTVTSTALAVGLGSARGEPVIGEPLAIEVDLIEAENLPNDCVRVEPPLNGSDEQYFPRQTRLVRGGDKNSVTVRGGEVKQPVIEFRLTIACNANISRDYVLFAAPSRELRHEPARAVSPAPSLAGTASAKPAAPAKPGAAVPSAAGAPSLERLARERYPQQPMAREKFKKMMRAANPTTLGGLGDDQPIAVAVETLRIPENLPQRRYGPYVPPGAEKKPPPSPPASRSVPATPAPERAAPSATPATAEAKPAKDRLSIGAAPGDAPDAAPPSPAEIAVQEKAQASFAAQDELAARLNQAEATYAQLKHLVLRMEARMDELEAERDRLKRENTQQAESAALELALSILFGGALGALAIVALQRRRKVQAAAPPIQESEQEQEAWPPTPVPAPTPPKIDLDDILVPRDPSESTWQAPR